MENIKFRQQPFSSSINCQKRCQTILSCAAPGFSLFTQRKRFSENKMAVSLFSQKMVIFYNYISPLHYQFNGTSYLHSFIGSIVHCTVHMAVSQHPIPLKGLNQQVTIRSGLQAAFSDTGRRFLKAVYRQFPPAFPD